MDTHLRAARHARNGIEKVRRELLDPCPESLERCAAPLQVAIECMDQLTTEISEARGAPWLAQTALRTEVLALQGDLSQITTLLRSAGCFYEGYGRLLACDDSQLAPVDYSRAGQVPSLLPKRKFEVHG